MTTYAVGIDVSKDTLDAVLIDSDAARTKHYLVANTAAGIAALLARIDKPAAHLAVGIEPTGVYSDKACRLLTEAGAAVHIITPFQSKQYRDICLHASKTDAQDAALLADYVLRHRDRLHRYVPADDAYEELDRLTRYRADLVEDRTRLKNQLGAERCADRPSAYVVEHIEQRLREIASRLADVERAIKSLIASRVDMRARVAHLLRIPGVGLVTTIIFLSATKGHVELRSARQWAAYAGLTAREKQSGKNNAPARLQRRGNNRLRSALYMAAMSAIRCDDGFAAKLEALKGKGICYKSAIVHIMNLLLRAMVGVCAHDADFDATYFPSLKIPA